jgi:hypothetical protein
MKSQPLSAVLFAICRLLLLSVPMASVLVPASASDLFELRPMKTVRILSAVAVLAFISGFWAACSIGFDPEAGDYQFSCTVDQDCVSTHQCKGGICTQRGAVASCTDNDGDGYGTGEERGDCPKCRDEGRCEEDCVDNDEAISPGLLDNCDGKDNNCDGNIDEPVPCEGIDASGCPDENPYLSSCVNNVCVYKPPLQIGAECLAEVACVGGAREDRPDTCF